MQAEEMSRQTIRVLGGACSSVSHAQQHRLITTPSNLPEERYLSTWDDRSGKKKVSE